MVTALSAPNIALIKYWGNRNDELRLPAADSLSMTLEAPTVRITVDHSPALIVRSFRSDTSERALQQKHVARFAEHLAHTKRYLQELGLEEAIPEAVSMEIRSEIPQAVGIASSAAVFSALAVAYGALVAERQELSSRELSIIARIGSGSAARSIFGGFVALINESTLRPVRTDIRPGGQHSGQANDPFDPSEWTFVRADSTQDRRANESTGTFIDSAYAQQIAAPDHWMLQDIILVPSTQEKSVGSTEGHHKAPTSPLFSARIEAIRTRRQQECVDAVLSRDFEKLQRVAEEDCLDMHRVMETQEPPLRYLTEDTLRIVREITDLRTREHLPVLYTMDAGPTVHLICAEEATDAVRAFARAQKGCGVIEAEVGSGARIL